MKSIFLFLLPLSLACSGPAKKSESRHPAQIFGGEESVQPSYINMEGGFVYEGGYTLTVFVVTGNVAKQMYSSMDAAEHSIPALPKGDSGGWRPGKTKKGLSYICTKYTDLEILDYECRMESNGRAGEINAVR